MGLIITNEIYTDAGVTSELYINVSRIEIIKDASISLVLNLYLNKEARLENIQDIINTRQVSKKLYIELTDQLNTLAIHEVVYNNLKTILESQGFTVINDMETQS